MSTGGLRFQRTSYSQGDPVVRHLEYFMGTAAPPAAPPRPVRNTASWSGTAYSSGQARLILQLTLISRDSSHVGTHWVGDGRPTAEVKAVRPGVSPSVCLSACLSVCLSASLSLSLFPPPLPLSLQPLLSTSFSVCLCPLSLSLFLCL